MLWRLSFMVAFGGFIAGCGGGGAEVSSAGGGASATMASTSGAESGSARASESDAASEQPLLVGVGRPSADSVRYYSYLPGRTSVEVPGLAGAKVVSVAAGSTLLAQYGELTYPLTASGASLLPRMLHWSWDGKIEWNPSATLIAYNEDFGGHVIKTRDGQPVASTLVGGRAGEDTSTVRFQTWVDDRHLIIGSPNRIATIDGSELRVGPEVGPACQGELGDDDSDPGSPLMLCDGSIVEIDVETGTTTMVAPLNAYTGGASGTVGVTWAPAGGALAVTIDNTSSADQVLTCRASAPDSCSRLTGLPQDAEGILTFFDSPAWTADGASLAFSIINPSGDVPGFKSGMTRSFVADVGTGKVAPLAMSECTSQSCSVLGYVGLDLAELPDWALRSDLSPIRDAEGLPPSSCPTDIEYLDASFTLTEPATETEPNTFLACQWAARDTALLSATGSDYGDDEAARVAFEKSITDSARYRINETLPEDDRYTIRDIDSQDDHFSVRADDPAAGFLFIVAAVRSGRYVCGGFGLIPYEDGRNDGRFRIDRDVAYEGVQRAVGALCGIG